MAQLWKLPAIYIIENNQLRHGHERSMRSSAHDPAEPSAASQLRHPRRAGRRHGRSAPCKAAGRQGRRAHCPRRRGPLHPRGARPTATAVTRCPIPAKYRTKRGGRRGQATTQRPDRAGAQPSCWPPPTSTEGGAQGHRRRESSAIVERGRSSSPKHEPGARSCPSSTPTSIAGARSQPSIWSYYHSSADAGAVPHHGERATLTKWLTSRQAMPCQGRPRDRRDRNRQGHDGSRGRPTRAKCSARSSSPRAPRTLKVNTPIATILAEGDDASAEATPSEPNAACEGV
jgi:hypothetical protein